MHDYRPATCAYCKADTWCETRANGKPQCRACKIERFFERVLYPPLGYQLLPWQRKVLRDLYGTVDEHGDRRYHRAFTSVAKKNGKSFLVGGLPIYHLLMEEEIRPEAYGAASAKDQAGIVFRAAASLVKANPDLSQRLRVIDSTRRILKRDGNGFYVVISADGDLQDGVEPSLAIRDEIHRWKTEKAQTLYDVLTKGMISRREPLDVAITTAGDEYESPLWVREHEIARMVLRGSLKSDRLYAAIWSADEDRLKADPDYWASREARIAANPSHEDLGGFLKDAAIVEELEKAQVNPGEKRKYCRYHLNVGINSGDDRAIPMDRWDACAGETRPLVDRVCYAALDLSSTIDLTSLVLLFPDEAGETYDVLPFFWIPKENVHERERTDKVEYRRWIEEGHLIATEGNVIDQRSVKAKIRWAAECFELREIGYDPWNAVQLSLDLIDEGFTCLPIRQGFQSMSAPTKKLLELVAAGKLRHGGHPVLRWNADCLSTTSDGNDNVRPKKPDRLKSSKRIDGIVALIMALDRATRTKPGMVYDGIRSVG